MSYVSRTLGKSESILFSTGYHWLYWVGVALLAGPFLALLILGTVELFPARDIFLLILAFVPFCYGAYRFVHGIALEIAVTSDRFVKKSGLVSIKSEEVSLDKIEEVSVEESILGRIFGFGTIFVHGTGAGEIRVPMLKDPVNLRRQIQTAREQLKHKGE
ncbi:MAG: PH domain-containing protein [Alphaproteobacteria bacterium]|nr:PH domain-containing protein [Alphaproteobacteria bacterium]